MKYKLKYDNINGFGFNSEKQEYEAGEPVKVTYFPIGTDTAYTFRANADDVVVKEQDSSATITFTMPAHDVEVTCSTRSTMGPAAVPGIGMPFMMTPEMIKLFQAQAPKSDKEWICPNCKTNNKGNFCCECATPRP